MAALEEGSLPAQAQAPEPSQTVASARKSLHASVVDKLDPAFVKLYNDYIANSPPSPTDLNGSRATYSGLYNYATAPATGVGGIGETTVPGWEKYPAEINVRVYVPPGEEAGQRKVWPVHFNFHGGGWALGDLETDAHLCHHICASVPCCVIDVGYRLVPEFPFPIGIMDSMSAVAHILVNHRTFSIDPNNITFGGSCAGATIALILNHIYRDAGFSDKVKGIIAGTPYLSDVQKCATPEMSPWPSMQESEHAPILDWSRIKWLDSMKSVSLAQGHRHVSHKEQQKDVSWFNNALNAPDFGNLAPLTWIGTAECDPLRDEAEAYAEKLEEAGNKVVRKRYTGVPHSFMHMDNILPQGSEYVQDVITHVRMCLYPSPAESAQEIPVRIPLPSQEQTADLAKHPDMTVKEETSDTNADAMDTDQPPAVDGV